MVAQEYHINNLGLEFKESSQGFCAKSSGLTKTSCLEYKTYIFKGWNMIWDHLCTEKDQVKGLEGKNAQWLDSAPLPPTNPATHQTWLPLLGISYQITSPRVYNAMHFVAAKNKTVKPPGTPDPAYFQNNSNGMNVSNIQSIYNHFPRGIIVESL